MYPIIRQSNSNILPDKGKGVKTELLQSLGKQQNGSDFSGHFWSHLVIAHPQERSFPPLRSFSLGEVQKAPWKVCAPLSLLMYK